MSAIPVVALDTVNPALFHKGLVVYLRLTDSCQLNCDHCFTHGNDKDFNILDVPATISFFKKLAYFAETSPYTRILLHGGEPFLVPTEHIFELHAGIQGKLRNLSWSVQTNLTFKLTPDILKVITVLCKNHLGTSWDKDLRWKNTRQKDLWRNNVRYLITEGAVITVMVTLDTAVLNTPPETILEELIELGVQYVSFERLTDYGNARKNAGIHPCNSAVNDYLLRMWKVTITNEYYKKIHNTYLNDTLTAFIERKTVGVNCRDCEVKILTVRADGYVSGCPDGADHIVYGHITDDVHSVLSSAPRRARVAHEAARHEECFTCEAFPICAGGCHQIEWDATACGAPKSLYTYLLQNLDYPLFRKVLGQSYGYS